MAENNTYILDASVLIKWLLNEDEGAIKMEELLQKYHDKKVNLLTTSLCYYEIMNTLGRIIPEKAMWLMSQILLLKVVEQLLTLEIGSIGISLMQQIPKTSFYDATYHATAIHNKGTFLTADEYYYKKAKKLGHIMLLKNYK